LYSTLFNKSSTTCTTEVRIKSKVTSPEHPDVFEMVTFHQNEDQSERNPVRTKTHAQRSPLEQKPSNLLIFSDTYGHRIQCLRTTCCCYSLFVSS